MLVSPRKLSHVGDINDKMRYVTKKLRLNSWRCIEDFLEIVESYISPTDTIGNATKLETETLQPSLNVVHYVFYISLVYNIL